MSEHESEQGGGGMGGEQSGGQQEQGGGGMGGEQSGGQQGQTDL